MSSMNQAKPLILMDIKELDANEFLLNTPEATYDLRFGLAGAKDHDPKFTRNRAEFMFEKYA